jgi:hypothetical protein
MAKLVVNGAKLKCNQGTSPASLAIAVPPHAQSGQEDMATVQDHQSSVNISSFGMCRSMANPQVASATAAAQGTLTPQPCNPVTSSPWTPGASKTTLGGEAVLTDDSKCTCAWGGTIEITSAGADTQLE